MTQFQAIPETQRTAQLLTYPVLMAHDVVGYSEVIVGDDQSQHIHYARDVIQRYNNSYGAEYPLPKAVTVAGRVKDLRNPENKMSKSNPAGCLFLNDSASIISAKIKKATMDEEGRRNLEFLYLKFVGENPPEMNQPLKERLTEALIAKFTRT